MCAIAAKEKSQPTNNLQSSIQLQSPGRRLDGRRGCKPFGIYHLNYLLCFGIMSFIVHAFNFPSHRYYIYADV
jgi:hypothetical protein